MWLSTNDTAFLTYSSKTYNLAYIDNEWDHTNGHPYISFGFPVSFFFKRHILPDIILCIYIIYKNEQIK